MPSFQITTLVSDQRIAISTYGQLCTLQGALVLPQDKKSALFRCVIETGRKLEAALYHRNNCLRLIDSEGRRISQDNELNEEVVSADITTGVEKEAEAFIMQGKSCLDVLIKALDPLLDIKLHSFGNSGDKVVSSLRRNLNREDLLRAEPLIEMLKSDRSWIHEWFKTERDSLDHYRALRSTGFLLATRAGKQVVTPPHLPGAVPLKSVVEVLYENLFTFCEDFLALSYSIKFLKGISLQIVPEDKRRSELPAKYCAVIHQ